MQEELADQVQQEVPPPAVKVLVERLLWEKDPLATLFFLKMGQQEKKKRKGES